MPQALTKRVFLLALLALLVAGAEARAQPPPAAEECLGCHADRDLKREAPARGQSASVFVDQGALRISAHGRLECAACHATATAPHEAQLPPVRCETCHAQPHEEVPGSVHARLGGGGASGACVACHGSHQIRPAAADGSAICATCHRRAATAVAASIHATARGDGKRTLPTCATCHTAHAVKSRRDPASPTHRSRIHETCAICHADPKVIREERIARPRVVALFEQSVHGRAIREQGNLKAATCTDCHGGHEILRAADPASTIFKRNVPVTCSHCHTDEAAQFRTSVHGEAVSRGIFAAPSCTDCHGEHGITATRAPGSPVAPLAVSTTCAACHKATPVIEEFGLAARRAGTFFDSFHGLAVRGGSPVVANCASCHGTHNIFPSSDPRSTIHPANLAGTCGQCHPGAGVQLASARIHVGPGFGEHPWVALVRRIYLGIILVTIGGMSLHNGLDFLTRLRERWRADVRGEGTEPPVPVEVARRLFTRLTVGERIQHGVLLTAFLVLVLTGFALKFPEAWWARPLVWIEGGYAIRSWAHRIAGVVLMAGGLYHLVYLLGTRRGRTQLRAMRPRWRDLREAWGLVAFNLGLCAERPRFHRFSYVEKLEYWAVVWGTAVMAATGVIMWFQTVVLRRWPLWSIDLATVIHYYEAWLATLAILVWHFYSVIFRPDVYPMSRVWLSGTLTGEQMAREHPAELEEILRAGGAREVGGGASGEEAR
ncbi:MAG TPA: cytochrome b/b6 domain-containing protein [Candidatus Methylomirabilis sp.]|nr:cytochrome b/b6 domain-containing protein [Candidatus Methylomirabilis sp.]